MAKEATVIYEKDPKKKSKRAGAKEHVHAVVPDTPVTGPKIKIPEPPSHVCTSTCTPQMKLVRPEACLARAAELGPVDTTAKVYSLLWPLIQGEDQEVFYVVPLDLRLNLRGGVVEVHRGARTHVEVTRVDCFRAAVVAGATHYIAVHGHPSGVAKPSKADRELHRTLAEFTRKTSRGEVKLLDSVVIGRGQYASIRDGGRVRGVKEVP